MNNKILYFSCGAAAGATATWFLLKRKYDAKLEEQTQSVIRAFTAQANRNARTSLENPDVVPLGDELSDTSSNEKDIMQNASELAKRPRVDYTLYGANDDTKIDEKCTEPVMCEAHVIAPDEYGENEEYIHVQMTQFYDGVITDDNLDMIEPNEVEKWLGGIDPMNHYGEYEDDAVHIRNDTMKCYVEIVKDERLFAAIMAERNRH